MRNLKNLFSIVLLFTAVALLLIPGPGGVSWAETIVVNKLEVAASDGSPLGFFDVDSTDGICADTTGGCNLLAALDHSKNTAGPDTIVFSVSGTIINSNFTITQDGTIIDGTTSDIVLEGKLSSRIIIIQSNSNVIKGLTFRGHPTGASSHGIEIIDGANNIIGGLTPAERNIFTGNSNGIWIHGAGAVDNVVIGNYIGVDSTGSVADGNNIGVNVALEAERNRIGGTTPAERNIISGNQNRGVNFGPSGNNNVVIGNYIGVDATGSIAISNTIGVFINGSSNNRIGGTTAGERNIISGNSLRGLYITSEESLTVVGNYIGTDVSGTVAIPNGTGIFMSTPSNLTIGGALTGEGNVISGNSLYGVYLSADSCKFIGNYIGTDATGSQPLGNDSVGIYFEWGADFNTIGGNSVAEGNRIAYNGFGLQITSPDLFFGGPTHYNTIRFNSFFNNIGSGIKFTGLTTQDDIVAPTITAATTSRIIGTAAPLATIDIYIADGIISDSAEGETYLATGTSDGAGAFTISLSGVTIDDRLTATVTDSLGNTSEFAVSAVAAGAQTGSIVLDSVSGLYAPDTLEVGVPIVFHLRMINNIGEAIRGFSNAFTVSSTKGAVWDTTDGAFTSAITSDMIDNLVNVQVSTDGFGADSIGFTGEASEASGIPEGFDDIVWTISIGPFDSLQHLNEICLDNLLFDQGTNIWFWNGTTLDSISPSWDGPHCFTIYDPPPVFATFPPILDSIGNQNVDENVNLNFTVTASDSDGTTPSLTSSTLPSGATFLPDTKGSIFDWTPDFTQAGNYSMTFYASDGSNTDSEVVTITVNSVPCPDLVVTSFTLDGPQQLSIGSPIGFRLNATVQNIGDAASSTITAGFFISADSVIAPPDSILSSGEVTIGVLQPGETISLIIDSLMPITSVPSLFTPAPVFLGLNLDYSGILTECNEQNNTDWLFVIVDDNLEPILDSIGNKVVNEGELLSFTVSAFDWDLDSLELFFFGPLSAESVFVDNGDGTGTFSWTPGFSEAGTLLVEFDVSDGNFGGIDFEEITITVVDVIQLPVFDSLPDTLTFDEGDAVSFSVSATDFEDFCLDIQLTSPDLPDTVTFVNGGECGEFMDFDWQTTFADAGIYHANFTVTDSDDGADTASVIIVVNNFNQIPLLDSIGNQSVNESETLVFQVTATDQDNDDILMTLIDTDLPSGYTYQELELKATTSIYEFRWTPTFDDSGTYTATFVSADSLEADSQTILITVNNLNRSPVIDSIGDKSVDENDTLSFIVTANDPDGDSIYFEVSGESFPNQAQFTDNGDGTMTVFWVPSFNDADFYDVSFGVFDTLDAFAFESISIIVNEVNSLPVFDSLQDTLTVDEGDLVSFFVSAQDFENFCLNIELTSPDLPLQDISFQNAGECGEFMGFDWQTSFADAGVYHANFTVTDDSGGVDTDSIVIIVNNVNQLPVLNSIGAQTYTENQYQEFDVWGVDLDNDGFNVTSSALPSGATFLSTSGGMTFAWQPSFAQSGNYNVTFYITDPLGGADSETVAITVNNVNRPPVFDSIGDKSVDENDTLSFIVTATDPDGDSIYITAGGEASPPQTAQFTDNGDGTMTVFWVPSFNDAGDYNVSFRAFDTLNAFDFESITIDVNEVNSLPVFDSLPDTLTFDEGDLVSFFVSAQDFENFCLNIELTSPDLPLQDISFQNAGECGEFMDFDWQTNFTDAGTYLANFTVTDDSGGVDIDSVIIVVNNVNQPPVQITGGDNSIFEGETLFLSVLATDLDNDSLVISISSDLPAAAFFLDNGNGNASLFWQTGFSDAGTYTAIFTASDGNGGIDEDTVSITIFNINQQPILDPLNDTTIVEGQFLILSLSGFDPDSESVFFIISGAPLGSDFKDNGDGTAIFSWTPTFDQAGEYFIEFFLEDNSKEGVSDSVVIIVKNFNRPPSFDQIPDTIVVDENSFTSFDVLAADPDGEDCLSLSLSSPDLPEQAIFVYDGDCLYFGRFEWETTYDDAGIYKAIFAVDDGLLGLAEDTVIIIVNNKNQPPRFKFIKFEETDEGVNLNFLIIATDGDSTFPVIKPIGPLPPGALYSDNRNGSGVFDWTPDFNQNGEYLITFVATDDSSATDTMDVFIFVNEAGDAELTVKNATCVQCSPAQNFTDIIVTERRFSIEFNSQINTLSLNGNLSFASTSGQTFDYFFEEYTKLLYVYPFSKSEPFRPADTITVFLSTGITDLSESPLDSNYSLTYFTGPIVYPGDADNNGVVDERDILSLGLYWNLTGPAREIAGEVSPLEFFPSPGHFQVLTEKWEPNLAAYADADGSGTVNADDICGVSFNFGLSNQSSQKNSGDMTAFKQLDNSVMQQMYNALIECPNSAGKIHLIEFLENAINSQSVILPTEVELYQNYPNPFNPSTTIEFYLPEQQYVTLDIYNILGQKVVSLVDRDMDAGFQSVNWSGRDNSGSEIASGIYFYLLQTDDRKISKRMMMLK